MNRKVIKFLNLFGDEIEAVFIPLSANAVVKMGEIIKDVRKDIKKKMSDPDFEQNEKYAENLVGVLDKPGLSNLIVASMGNELETEAKALILTPENEDGYKEKLEEKVKGLREERRKELVETDIEELKIQAKIIMMSSIEYSFILKPTYDFILSQCLRSPTKLEDKIFSSPEDVGDKIESKTFDAIITEWIEFGKSRTDDEAKK